MTEVIIGNASPFLMYKYAVKIDDRTNSDEMYQCITWNTTKLTHEFVRGEARIKIHLRDAQDDRLPDALFRLSKFNHNIKLLQYSNDELTRITSFNNCEIKKIRHAGLYYSEKAHSKWIITARTDLVEFEHYT